MSRHRDKRAAFVLALLLVLVFAFGQARRADADRHEATAPVQNLP
jgi:cbb3-type cytochrome oxidase subunit 3